jgi:hypothetical protein
MFKKELTDILKQTGWFLLAVAVLPVPLILLKWVTGPYSAALVSSLQIGLVFWSLFLGASLFGRERGQRALEYALSLPLSRMRLLLQLAGPRLLVFAGLWLAAWAGLAAAGFSEAGELIPGLALMVGLSLFLVSLSLSVVIDNFIVLCVASLVGWDAALALISRLLWGFGQRSLDPPLPGMLAFSRPGWDPFPIERSLPLVLLYLVLPVAPFVAGLLLSIGRFDVRRSARFVRRYLLVLASGLGACALIALGANAVARSHAFKDYYLTRDLKLIEWSFTSDSIRGRVLGKGTALTIKMDGDPWGSWDDGGFLYSRDYSGNIVRFDLATCREERIYRSERAPVRHSEATYGGTVAFFEFGSRPGEIQLVALDLATKTSERRTFVHEAFRPRDRGGRPSAVGDREPTLIGTGVQNGLRFWICATANKDMKSTLRLWEDGRVEEIRLHGRLETPNAPCYVNGLILFMGREPIAILEDGGSSFVLKKEFPAAETFRAAAYPLSRKSIDTTEGPFFYGKRAGHLARMNMGTLEIEDIGKWAEDGDAWGYVFMGGERPYFVGGSRRGKAIEVFDLSAGTMRLVRTFQPVDVGRRYTYFRPFESGVLLVQGNRVHVYAFPDLREIRP